ncbi:hypothetical protein [Pedobacter sp. L105]|uniref:hypothetical protein n=1 Tax=Pedobacter sp. L105 TaxID=1641871 RepID=UPI00131C7BCF|nr:hypothetical protein [Pedobacter sp. L105]
MTNSEKLIELKSVALSAQKYLYHLESKLTQNPDDKELLRTIKTAQLSLTSKKIEFSKLLTEIKDDKSADDEFKETVIFSLN